MTAHLMLNQRLTTVTNYHYISMGAQHAQHTPNHVAHIYKRVILMRSLKPKKTNDINNCATCSSQIFTSRRNPIENQQKKSAQHASPLKGGYIHARARRHTETYQFRMLGLRFAAPPATSGSPRMEPKKKDTGYDDVDTNETAGAA